MRVLQQIYGDAASDIKSALTTGHTGPGGQLSEAVLRDYHFYGHAAAGRLAIARSLAEAIYRGREGVNGVCWHVHGVAAKLITPHPALHMG